MPSDKQLLDCLEKMAGRKSKDEGELHLCWLVEESFTKAQKRTFAETICYKTSDEGYSNQLERLYHATWQQRTIALAKTLNIEIV